MQRLYKKLTDYAASDYYPFHMPGHKRNPGITGADLPYEIDITEIEGFDDLHHASSVLKEAEERAAEAYDADETHYLINGSTAGLLSAVLGCTERGGKILMARNCHKSVYNAVFLNELHPVYLYPEFDEETELNGEISPAKAEHLLNEVEDIQAVVITSPTYDGVVSDVEKIAEIAHAKGIPLIVDEAHGAHFGFHPYFPNNSNTKGADVVIHSLHKTLPSLTQTALLHMNGALADRRRVRKYLHLLQSSSPSYILMAGMDECIRAVSDRDSSIWNDYTECLDRTRGSLKGLKHLKLLETERYDRSKLLISVKGLRRKSIEDGAVPFTGKELYRILLERYHLQMEMAAGSYIVAMTAPGDTEAGMRRLVNALTEIDNEMVFYSEGEAEQDMDEKLESCPEHAGTAETEKGRLARQEQVYTAWEAELLKEAAVKECTVKEGAGGGRAGAVPWERAEGRIALEYAYLYPPGIPLVVPGERIGKAAAEQMTAYERMGFSIEGTEAKGKIEVWINE